uniref:NADH-ubiquinone oxidoreductase chain 4 n=1 Tax=Brachycladium goliath TaxID=1751714 RepID=A0A140B0Z6_9TREM|nr:NADH dehydrogenase subunit 4 [Brachycladium goliath]ALN38358.1 NADH dehydrogenase subunit 4 [Brachycladium goliath]
MGFKEVDGYSWLVGFFLVLLSVLLFGVFGFSCQDFCISSVGSVVWGVFCFDFVGCYLVLLSVLLWLSLLFFCGWVSRVSLFWIGVSVFFSVLSYVCVHALWFWVFYELSILPLLLLLVLESPYSERYVASWYLLGYVVLTSLPMLLCFYYISSEIGSFSICLWGSEGLGVGVFFVLGVMFITKIPLPPFHVWLPIVHAEATSAVSVCLSGYIMKLGILGVVRFGTRFLSDYIFSSLYMLVVLGVSVLFFFSASRELDGKRWLAFLSLSHILIASLCLCVVGFDGSGLSLLYCLGHGFSAGVTFVLLWVVYEVSGSRNWGVLKYGLSSSLLVRCLCGACLCTVASLPPTVQFFCEVFVVSEAGFVSVLFFFVLFLYLFFGGLVPVFLLGGLLSRHYNIGFGGGKIFGALGSVLLLLVWGFGLFLVG